MSERLRAILQLIDMLRPVGRFAGSVICLRKVDIWGFLRKCEAEDMFPLSSGGMNQQFHILQPRGDGMLLILLKEGFHFSTVRTERSRFAEKKET